MDPAGPAFFMWDTAGRLTSNDAKYVEAIHTDNMLGFYEPLAQSDFYVSGGIDQPPCVGFDPIVCDHFFAITAWIESLNSDALWGRRCVDFGQQISNQCSGNGQALGGEPSNSDIALTGIFRVPVNSAPPFGKGPY